LLGHPFPLTITEDDAFCGAAGDVCGAGRSIFRPWGLCSVTGPRAPCAPGVVRRQRASAFYCFYYVQRGALSFVLGCPCLRSGGAHKSMLCVVHANVISA
jgi:hypothetical protein